MSKKLHTFFTLAFFALLQNSFAQCTHSIDLTDITLNDFTFDVGSVSKTEFGYLNGVTSAIQTQLDARALESVIGDAIEADDLELSGTTLQLVAEIPHNNAYKGTRFH